MRLQVLYWGSIRIPASLSSGCANCDKGGSERRCKNRTSCLLGESERPGVGGASTICLICWTGNWYPATAAPVSKSDPPLLSLPVAVVDPAAVSSATGARHCSEWNPGIAAEGFILCLSLRLFVSVSLSLNSWWSGRGNGIQNEEERWVSSLTLESVLLAYPWRNPRIFAEKVNKNLCCCCCGGLYLSLLLLQSVCCCGDNFLLCYLIDPILLLTQTNPRERPCGMCEGLEFSCCWAWAESTRAWAPWRGF